MPGALVVGGPIGEDLGTGVYDRLFNDPHAPDVVVHLAEQDVRPRPRTFEEDSTPPPRSRHRAAGVRNTSFILHVSYFEWSRRPGSGVGTYPEVRRRLRGPAKGQAIIGYPASRMPAQREWEPPSPSCAARLDGPA